MHDWPNAGSSGEIVNLLRRSYIVGFFTLMVLLVAVGWSTVAGAAPEGSLFLDAATDESGKKVDVITEPTWTPPIAEAPAGFPAADLDADLDDLSEKYEDADLIDYEDLTDAERDKLNRVNELNPILRNAAAIFVFFLVLGAGVTLVNYRWELK